MFRTVSIVSVKNGGNDPAVSTTRAMRGKVSWRVIQMLSAAAVKPECMYSIPYTLAPGPWKPGDLLTDASQVDATSAAAGVTYTVQLVEVDEGFWILYVFNPKISYNLKDTGTILVATEVLTGVGTRTVTYADLYTSQACRIQPSSSNWAVTHGRVGDSKVFDVFMANDFDIQPSKHLFKWTSGSDTFEADIREVRNRESISDLMVLTVELRVGATGTV